MQDTTFGIIKPDVVRRGKTGQMLGVIEAMGAASGVRLTGICLVRLTESFLKSLYAAHLTKDYWPAHLAFMTSDRAVLLRLTGVDVVARWREMMGPTDPRNAPPGTLRHLYGSGVPENAVHGSDAAHTAAEELSLVAYHYPGAFS